MSAGGLGASVRCKSQNWDKGGMLWIKTFLAA